LASRDSLRLEMGYALYGHDIDAQTTPIEAGLRWVMGKFNDSFIGAAIVMPQKENGPARKLCGFVIEGRGIAREGAIVKNVAGQEIGKVTSGGHSPIRGEALGLAYIQSESAENGAAIMIEVRGKDWPAKIAPPPFVEAKTKTATQKKKAA